MSPEVWARKTDMENTEVPLCLLMRCLGIVRDWWICMFV